MQDHSPLPLASAGSISSFAPQPGTHALRSAPAPDVLAQHRLKWRASAPQSLIELIPRRNPAPACRGFRAQCDSARQGQHRIAIEQYELATGRLHRPEAAQKSQRADRTSKSDKSADADE